MSGWRRFKMPDSRTARRHCTKHGNEPRSKTRVKLAMNARVNELKKQIMSEISSA